MSDIRNHANLTRVDDPGRFADLRELLAEDVRVLAHGAALLRGISAEVLVLGEAPQITRTVAVRCASGRCVIQWLHSTVTGKVSPEIAPAGGRSRTS